MTDTTDLEKQVAEFRVRLFLSVDLSGSTAFKISEFGETREQGSAAPRWVSHFEQFYINFPDKFKTNYQLMTEKFEGEDLCPQLWRTAGDELVFCGRVTNQRSILMMLEAFIVTISEFRKNYFGKNVSLDLKGAAWVATFPEPNRSIQVLRSSEKLQFVTASEALEREADLNPFECDFQGKSMDTGFRVAHIARPERFTLSVQLARIVLNSPPKYVFSRDIRLDEPVVLKGVNGGMPYPVLFIDTMEHLSSAGVKTMERALLGRAEAPDGEDLERYLRSYCAEVGTELVSLPRCSSFGPIQPSKSYLLHKSKISDHLLNLVSHSQGEEQDGETDGSATDLEVKGTLRPLS
ncbi:hypothetical protein HGG73_12700 [Rhodobacteraceae bacterium R_SAG3]|nr:hypothetical protein [Rhodobacteraceae bacterium R_SAG3]